MWRQYNSGSLQLCFATMSARIVLLHALLYSIRTLEMYSYTRSFPFKSILYSYLISVQ